MPLTNAFVGEFLMFSGIVSSKITQYGLAFMVAAGSGVILGAAYTLRMAGKVFLGETNALTEKGTDIALHEIVILGIIAVTIIVSGIYPQHLLESFNDITQSILKNSDVLPLLKKH